MDIIYEILGLGVIVWFVWALYEIVDEDIRLYNETHDGHEGADKRIT